MILYVLSGLAGAGKTTRAMQLIAETGAVLLCRDELRTSLRHCADETAISHMMQEMASVLLSHGFDVVVDAWNLHPADEQNWRNVADQTNSVLEWIHLSTPVEVCIMRDSHRPTPVGAARITEAAAEFLDQRLKLSS